MQQLLVDILEQCGHSGGLRREVEVEGRACDTRRLRDVVDANGGEGTRLQQPLERLQERGAPRLSLARSALIAPGRLPELLPGLLRAHVVTFSNIARPVSR